MVTSVARILRPYRPSSGTEGMVFIEAHCAKCIKDRNHDCPILAATMAFSVTDERYPKEWVELDSGPFCTAYVPDEGQDPNQPAIGKVAADIPQSFNHVQIRPMNYLSVCSGIEAATVAWHPLGWTPAAFSEIEKFPSELLAHHYPTVPNHGDMTRFQEWPDADLSLLVGGTPCQSFSVAGLRKGLADPRGNLTLTYLAIAARYRPEWLVWENVPGVLSDGDGAFWQFLDGLSELGYGWAWRVLDAQYFGVAQRRRRPFVVGHLGDWRRAAAVLFERESLSGNPAPSRESRERAAPSLAARTRGDGGLGTDAELDGALVAHSLKADGFDASEDGTGRSTPLVPEVMGTLGQRMRGPIDSMFDGAAIPEIVGTLSDGAHMGGGLTVRTPIAAELSLCLNAGAMGRIDAESETLIPERTGGGFDVAFAQNQRQEVRELEVAGALPAIRRGDAKNETLLAFSCKDHGADAGELAPTLRSMGHDGSHANAGGQVAVAIDWQNSAGGPNSEETFQTLTKDRSPAVMGGMQVRRLTPRECERLQGFPDDYTLIPRKGGKLAADGPRYKALGNSMAVSRSCGGSVSASAMYIAKGHRHETRPNHARSCRRASRARSAPHRPHRPSRYEYGV